MEAEPAVLGGSITSRLKSFGVVHAALRVQSGEAVSELDRRKAAVPGWRRAYSASPACTSWRSGCGRRPAAQDAAWPTKAQRPPDGGYHGVILATTEPERNLMNAPRPDPDLLVVIPAGRRRRRHDP